MARSIHFVLCVLTCALLAREARAADPPAKLTAEQRKELSARLNGRYAAGVKAYQAGKLPEATEAFGEALGAARRLYPKDEYPDGHNDLATLLTYLGMLYLDQGKFADAEPAFKEALGVARRLYPKDKYPDGHANLASGLNNLAALYRVQGKLDTAEPLLKESLRMAKRLFKGDHPDVANSLLNLAGLYKDQGKLSDAEPLYREGLGMYQRHFKGDHPAVATGLNNLAGLYQGQGKLSDAEPLFKEALGMRKRLYKGGHPDIAISLSGLAGLYADQGKLSAAEPLYKEALELIKRVFEGDHPYLASSLNNLAGLYVDQGKLTAAEPLYREALAMRKRLYKGDHPDLALGLNNLAGLYRDQGKAAAAEPLFKEALAMARRVYKGDHPQVALILNNLAGLYDTQGRLAVTESLFKEALEMYQRLFKGDHPDVATGLNNLAGMYEAQGKLAEAEPLYEQALAMRKRLYKGDHPLVAKGLSNMGSVYRAQEKLANADKVFQQSLAMNKRLTTRYAREKSEGEALTLVGSLPLTRGAYLSLARARTAEPAYDPATAYPAVWASKGAVARVFEQRHLRARAANDPALAQMAADLADARRRRADLLLAGASTDPATRKQRAAAIKGHEETIARLDRELSRRLPAVARAAKLDAATVADLQKALPAHAALVDYVHYTYFGWDNARPPGDKETRTRRYLAFVVTKGQVAWADLGTAEDIEEAVGAWRAAITGDKAIPAALPARVRALVWDPVRKELPAGVKTVYVCPDGVLCRLPFAALPGDKEGTVLLEDYALAMVPHAPFLLDRLWPQDPRKGPPMSALVVGDVRYNATGKEPVKVAVRSGPLVKPGAELAWDDLPATAPEAQNVADAAAKHKLPVTHLQGGKATAAAVLRALPGAKVAHLATHGFFADPSFRGLFDLDENDYRKSLRGERIGRAVNSPLVMTGLVLAGANDPGTPGRGIVTGEALVDLDLGGLELAVLSACDTGLGEVAGGEGAFGLQRAFHYAGGHNVVASLWQVDDAATSLLMRRFYHHLWDKKLPPVEALRRAQLSILRDPEGTRKEALALRTEWAKRGLKGTRELPPAGPEAKRSHPALWAAFSLSGTGR